MLSNTLTIIFNLCIWQSLFFVHLNIFEYILLIHLKITKSQKKQNGSKRNSKKQCPILMKFVTDVKKDIIYKIMKFLFVCLFVCLFGFFFLFFFCFCFCFCFCFLFFVLFCFFGKNVSFLNYVAKYPNWLLPDYHDNQFTNPASFLCVLFPCILLQIWCQSIVHV